MPPFRPFTPSLSLIRHSSSSSSSPSPSPTPSPTKKPRSHRLPNMGRPHSRVPTSTELSLARKLAVEQYRRRPLSPTHDDVGKSPWNPFRSRRAAEAGAEGEKRIGNVLDRVGAEYGYTGGGLSPGDSERSPPPNPKAGQNPTPTDGWSSLHLSGLPPPPGSSSSQHSLIHPPPPTVSTSSPDPPEENVLTHLQRRALIRRSIRERTDEERSRKGDGVMENEEEEGRRKVEERRRWTFRGRMDSWWDENLGKKKSGRRVGVGKFVRPSNEIWAQTDPLKTSTRKLRPLLNLISSQPLSTALLLLSQSLLRPAPPVSRLLLLAQSRAHSLGLDPSLLIVSRAWTTKGVKLKRYDAKARGRAGIKHHPSARAHVVVKEGERREERERRELVRVVRRRVRTGAGVKGTEDGVWWNAPVGRWV